MIPLSKLFEYHQLYHSELQQDYFITAKSGGTEWGMFKQALRELHKRYRGLKQLYTEKELLNIDIEELKQKKILNKFTKRRNKINLTQKIMNMEEIDLNIKETEREFERFYKQACTFLRKLEIRHGKLTQEIIRQLDEDMHLYKLKEQIALDFMSIGRVQHNTIENIMCLPIPKRKFLLYFIRRENQNELIDWYESKQPEQLILPKDNINVKNLLE